MKKIITVFSILFILILAGLFYFFKFKNQNLAVKDIKRPSISAHDTIQKIDTAFMVPAQNSQEINVKNKNHSVSKFFEGEDFKKWEGIYFTSFIEAQGEGAYNAIIELNIKSPEEGHFQLYYQDLNDTVKSNKTKIFGSFKPFGKNNSALEFLPEVLYEGEDNGFNQSFKLYVENGNYFIQTAMVVPENVPKDRIPLRKIMTK